MSEESFQKSRGGENSSQDLMSQDLDWRSRQVVSALWRAFPEAVSEHDLAQMAAPYFRDLRHGRPIAPRTVRLWLSGVSLPRMEHFCVLVALVGADFFALPRAGAMLARRRGR